MTSVAAQGVLSAAERSLRSVFVGNIPYEATEEQLKDIFSEVGPVVSFRLVYDRETGKPKGYGFCEYKDQETALSAMRNLNSHELNGRSLRVDNAASEKTREELTLASLGGPQVESPYGAELEPEKAPEAISKAVASLPPEQMFELMKQMKLCVQNNPSEARVMLLQNPQLAYALLQAQVIMKVVDPQVAISLLSRQNSNPAVPAPDSDPSLLANASNFGGQQAPEVQMFVGGDSSRGARPAPAGRPSLLGDRPISNEPSATFPSYTPPERESRISDPRSSNDRDMRQLNAGDRDMRQLPAPPSADRDLRANLSADGDMRSNHTIDRDMRQQQQQQQPPSHDLDMRFMGGTPNSGPPDNFENNRFRGGNQFDPRMGPRNNFNPRAPQSFDPRGAPPPPPPAAPVPGGMNVVRPPIRAPAPNSPQDPQTIAANAAARMPQLAGSNDQEKTALIMQVLQLSDQQISMLPPGQRQSIYILKNQIARSQQ